MNAGVLDRGFDIIPDVLDHHETAELLDDLTRTSITSSKAGVRHAMRNPLVARFASAPKLLGIATDVLGTAVPFRATLFDKSADSNWLIVWHQDTALPLRGRRDVPGWGAWSLKQGTIYAHAPATALQNVVALRVHLDEQTVDNGPLRVLPGTHTLGVLDDDELDELARKIEPVDCIVGRGGIVVMRPLLVHSSSKLRDKNRRRVLHIEYTTSLQMEDGLDLAVV